VLPSLETVPSTCIHIGLTPPPGWRWRSESLQGSATDSRELWRSIRSGARLCCTTLPRPRDARHSQLRQTSLETPKQSAVGFASTSSVPHHAACLSPHDDSRGVDGRRSPVFEKEDAPQATQRSVPASRRRHPQLLHTPEGAVLATPLAPSRQTIATTPYKSEGPAEVLLTPSSVARGLMDD
jgi:hypothetical protein